MSTKCCSRGAVVKSEEMKMTGTKSGLIWFCYGNLIQGSITFYSSLKPGLFPIYLSKIQECLIYDILTFSVAMIIKFQQQQQYKVILFNRALNRSGTGSIMCLPQKCLFFVKPSIHPSVLLPCLVWTFYELEVGVSDLSFWGLALCCDPGSVPEALFNDKCKQSRRRWKKVHRKKVRQVTTSSKSTGILY